MRNYDPDVIAQFGVVITSRQRYSTVPCKSFSALLFRVIVGCTKVKRADGLSCVVGDTPHPYWGTWNAFDDRGNNHIGESELK